MTTPYRTESLRHIPRTVVDEADYGLVEAAGPWHLSICDGKWYARRPVRGGDGSVRWQGMHTFLTGWPLVDHIDGDGLNNRRSNLRPATPSQNNANRRKSRQNTSGFKGVSYYHRTSRWRAYVGVDGKAIHLGYFDTAIDAARAYDAAALEHFGEFARINFPEGDSHD